MNPKMLGAILPGNSTAELREFGIPKPGHGQVLVKTKASTICGSDIRCIYRAHVGKGPEGYQPGMIAGHEPCGVIVQEGEGLKRFKKGDRVIVYHISGCGVCYAYLVSTGEALTAETATAQVALTAGAAQTIDYSGDVNMSGKVDLNDAQLVYDLYNATYYDFSTVSMGKMLRADVSKDKKIDVSDVTAIVAIVRK